jgi:hypothetical protein
MTDREMIESACASQGLTIQGWATTDDGHTAQLGRYVVSTPDYEDDGLYEGDEGTLDAVVVGSEKYENRRVSFTFTADGLDGGEEVSDLTALDPVD